MDNFDDTITDGHINEQWQLTLLKLQYIDQPDIIDT